MVATVPLMAESQAYEKPHTMDLSHIPENFDVLDDPLAENTSLPAFMVSKVRGFLPRAEPVINLPPEFEALEALLQRMPIRTSSGAPGLLATGSLGKAIDEERVLPNLVNDVHKYKDNLPVLNALYRDYSFVASAYLLEPCHMRWVEGKTVVKGPDGEDETKGGDYGLGRDVLPECISVPIAAVAKYTGKPLFVIFSKLSTKERIGFQPFMEYAGSYALYNYKLNDPTKPITYDNISLIRAFEHGLDSKSSEAGFVLVHVDMVKESGPLVTGALKVVDGCTQRDRSTLNEGLDEMLAALGKINNVMEEMWKKSKPGDYNSFRTFIFGITSQSMFPNGVLYQGVSSERQYFRGESGANDSMVPLVDNLLQIRMPDTPLTEILRDFRKYRPGNHREFLEWIHCRAETLGIREWCLEEPESAEKYLLCLDQIRGFRWRHWCFTREYILKKTGHPTATGGSPIVTWLPNQLNSVLLLMKEVLDKLAVHNVKSRAVETVREVTERQSERLAKEVAKYCAERGV